MKRNYVPEDSLTTRFHLAVVWLILSLGCMPASATPAIGETPPNFIVVYTDDQRGDTLFAMPSVLSEIVGKGVIFRKAFVTVPVCCPSRASFYSGGFTPRHTGVTANVEPNGGMRRFDDSATLATRLQQAGYRTGFIGKYMNTYGVVTREETAPYVPPGWTEWYGFAQNRYFDPLVVRGSTSFDRAGTGVSRRLSGYSTELMEGAAVQFIERNRDGPFFLMVCTRSPHTPTVPAPGDEEAFADFVHQRANLDEADLTDKPSWVQRAAGPEDFTETTRDQLRSLIAVDRLVASVVAALEKQGIGSQTYVIFTSDHGFMWGEHGLYRKSKPYEESIQVPLVIRTPDAQPGADAHLVSSDLDVPATILDLAGLQPAADGFSLAPLLDGTFEPPWSRQVLLIEQSREERFDVDGPPIWVGARTRDFKLVDWIHSGETEFYDLRDDPYELSSRHDDPALQDEIAVIRALVRERMSMVISTPPVLPVATQANPYSVQLSVLGGVAPITWSAPEGDLPAGLALAAEGILAGTPTGEGRRRFSIRAIDSSISPQHGGPQEFTVEFELTIRGSNDRFR